MKWILVIAATGLFACGGDDDDDAAGDGGVMANDGPAANCVPRCEAKLNACGQAAFTVGCPSIVCGSATESQLACVEASSCEQIQTAISNDMELCGIGGDGDGMCPTLMNCACGVSGVVQINGRCAMSCDEACAALSGR